MLLWDNTVSQGPYIYQCKLYYLRRNFVHDSLSFYSTSGTPFLPVFPKDIELCSRTASGPCSSLSVHALEFILWRLLGTARSFLRSPSCWQMSLQRAYLKWHFLLARQIPSFCLPHFAAVTSASWIINAFLSPLPLLRCLKIMAVVLNPR